MNGVIRFADHTQTYCLLKINELENGKLIDVGVFMKQGGIVFSSHTKFLSCIGKTSSAVHPFRYQYSVDINCKDLHIDKDGWSFPISLNNPDLHVEKHTKKIGGLSFKDTCPGTDSDRYDFVYSQYPGTMQGYNEVIQCAKRFGVRVTPITHDVDECHLMYKFLHFHCCCMCCS